MSTKTKTMIRILIIFFIAFFSVEAHIWAFRLDMQNNIPVLNSILGIFFHALITSVAPILLVLSLNEQGLPLEKKPGLQEGKKYRIVSVSVELQAFRYPPEEVLYAAQRISDKTDKNNKGGGIIFFYSKAIIPIKKPGGEIFQIVDGLLVPSSV